MSVFFTPRPQPEPEPQGVFQQVQSHPTFSAEVAEAAEAAIAQARSGIREYRAPNYLGTQTQINMVQFVSEKLVATGQAVNPGGAKEFEASIKKQIDQVTTIAKLVGMKTR